MLCERVSSFFPGSMPVQALSAATSSPATWHLPPLSTAVTACVRYSQQLNKSPQGPLPLDSSCPSPAPGTEGALPPNWLHQYLPTPLVENQVQGALLIPGERVNTDSQFKLQDWKLGEWEGGAIQAAFIPGLRNSRFAGELGSLQPMEERKCSEK